MSLMPFFHWCDASWLGAAVRSSTWAFALIECFHLLGMVCLLGSLVVVDLRLMGFGMRGQPVARVAKALEPVTLFGLAVMVLSGVMLFTSEALKCYDNPAFLWKMLFLALGTIVWFTFHRRITRLDDDRIGSVRGKLLGGLSLVLWFGVALAGRAIAYV
jgi:hypothetical protein